MVKTGSICSSYRMLEALEISYVPVAYSQSLRHLFMPSCGVRQTIGSPLITVREANTNTSPSVVDFGARIAQSAFAHCVETWRTWKKS